MKALSFEKLLHHLKQGGLILYPTETLWGLGCDALNPQAVENLRRLKNRPPAKAMSVLVSGINEGERYCHIPQEAQNFLHLVWPGPVGLVLPCHHTDLAESVGQEGFVCLRCTPNPWVRKLHLYAQGPIVSTSVNSSGDKAMENLDDMQNFLPSSVAIDQSLLKHPMQEPALWPRAHSKGSTLFKWVGSNASNPLQLLREGDISGWC